MLGRDSLELLVRKLATHSTLSADSRAAILALPFKTRTLDSSSYLIREGDAPGTCAVILDGFAYRQKTTGEGTRQIVSLHIPGDPLDLQHLALDVADHNVQTLTRTTVALIPQAELTALATARPEVARAFYVAVLVEASIFREWLLNVGRRDAQARLAHLLCEFAIRMDAQGLADRTGYELPMTQEQLGDALGLTAVHVNRTLRNLELLGLIVRNRRHISFPSWEPMRDYADFSARYLHLVRPPG